MKTLIIVLLVLFCAVELASFTCAQEFGQIPEEVDVSIQEEDEAEPNFQERTAESLLEE